MANAVSSRHNRTPRQGKSNAARALITRYSRFNACAPEERTGGLRAVRNAPGVGACRWIGLSALECSGDAPVPSTERQHTQLWLRRFPTRSAGSVPEMRFLFEHQSNPMRLPTASQRTPQVSAGYRSMVRAACATKMTFSERTSGFKSEDVSMSARNWRPPPLFKGAVDEWTVNRPRVKHVNMARPLRRRTHRNQAVRRDGAVHDALVR